MIRRAAVVLTLIVVACGQRTFPTPEERGELRGTVTEQDGTPVPRASIGLNLGADVGFGVPGKGIVTDDEGTYDWGSLPEGTYEVTVYADGYKRATKTTRLEAGRVTILDFTVDPMG